MKIYIKEIILMARKKKPTTTNSSGTSNYDVIKFCAFWGLVIAAIAACISFVLGILNICGIQWGLLSRVVGICNTVSQIALLVAVILPAYKYARGKGTVYRAFFWVAVIFLVLGIVGINLAI